MTNSKYDFEWKDPLNVESKDGSKIEQNPADRLNRARLASFITNNVVPDASQRGYVLNLNAQWGAGKTFFVQRWADSLNKNGHPTVYIDAWKQDFSDDPMLTVIASIIEQLKGYLDKPDQYVAKIADKGWRFFKATGAEVTKGILKKVSGIDINNITNELEDNSDTNNQNNSFDGSVASKLTAALIDDHNSKLASVEGLKHELGEWAEAIITKGSNGTLSAPVFIFIDELDRCRPNYAVEMLEVIKHFFKIKNLVFVVSTDTTQLQHAVKAVYGENFDAQTYLHRFFDTRYSLNESSLEDFIKNKVDIALSSSDVLGTFTSWPIVNNKETLASLLTTLGNGFSLSLRDIEQLIERLFSILRNLPANQSLNICYLTILLIIREKDVALYREIVSRKKNSGKLIIKSNTIKDFNVYFALQDNGFRRTYSTPETPTSNNYRQYGYTFRVFELIDIYSEITLLGERGEQYEREQELSKVINELSSQQRYANWEALAQLKAQLQMLDYYQNISVYKDWVELATAFDG
ncbi:TPA: KAP family P-loop NTPase fold protein [Photobacterium damselae]